MPPVPRDHLGDQVSRVHVVSKVTGVLMARLVHRVSVELTGYQASPAPRVMLALSVPRGTQAFLA